MFIIFIATIVREKKRQRITSREGEEEGRRKRKRKRNKRKRRREKKTKVYGGKSSKLHCHCLVFSILFNFLGLSPLGGS
jgi:hypothetical protein